MFKPVCFGNFPILTYTEITAHLSNRNACLNRYLNRNSRKDMKSPQTNALIRVIPKQSEIWIGFPWCLQCSLSCHFSLHTRFKIEWSAQIQNSPMLSRMLDNIYLVFRCVLFRLGLSSIANGVSFAFSMLNKFHNV